MAEPCDRPIQRADLHVHTSRSDGVLAPAELVRQARTAGLDCLGVADHDSVAGIAEARAAGEALGICIIPGIELSTRDVEPATGTRSEEHLLALFVDPADPALTAYLADLQAGREAMARATLARLADLGLPLDPARVAALAEGAVVTRPHIARALVEAGYVPDERAAFERLLGTGRPAALERPSATSAEAIAVARAAGGVVALAHPVFPQEADWQARLATVPERLDRLAAAGLAAVECFYPDATPEISDRLLGWTSERGLVATGGSDYHGPDKAPYVPLGHTSVGGEVVQALWARRPSPAPTRVS